MGVDLDRAASAPATWRSPWSGSPSGTPCTAVPSPPPARSCPGRKMPRARPSRSCCRCCSPTSSRSRRPRGEHAHVGAGVHPLHGGVAMPTLYALGEAPLWAVGVSMLLTVVAIVGGRGAGREDLRALCAAQPQALLARRLPPAREIDTRQSRRRRLRPNVTCDLGQRAPTCTDNPRQAGAGRDRWRPRQQLTEEVAVDVGACRP